MLSHSRWLTMHHLALDLHCYMPQPVGVTWISFSCVRNLNIFCISCADYCTHAVAEECGAMPDLKDKEGEVSSAIVWVWSQI
jgi:hypothetical protein